MAASFVQCLHKAFRAHSSFNDGFVECWNVI